MQQFLEKHFDHPRLCSLVFLSHLPTNYSYGPMMGLLKINSEHYFEARFHTYLWWNTAYTSICSRFGARRHKKAFLSDQCKEIEENNRMGKTRDLFKKIRETKRTFHAKMGSIKERDGMDLRKAEDVKKRWQEYTEELYKKDFKTKITTMVWSLTWSQTSWNVKSSGPEKASLPTKIVEVMEFQLSCFKSWKMMLWKCCTLCDSKFGKLSSGHRTGKGQFSFQFQRKVMPKNAQTTAQLHSSHTLVK